MFCLCFCCDLDRCTAGMRHHHIPFFEGKTANLKVLKSSKCDKLVASFLKAAVSRDGTLVGHVMLCVHARLATATL